jgi:hypothetical protein
MLNDVWLRLGIRAKIDVYGDNDKDFFVCMNGKDIYKNPWPKEHVLWVHPPQKEMLKALQLIQYFKIQAVVIAPVLKEEPAWSPFLWSMAKKYFKYTAESHFFKGDLQPEQGTWAVLVDGNNTISGGEDDDYMMIAEADIQDTGSRSRRQRRRQLEQAIREKKKIRR